MQRFLTKVMVNYFTEILDKNLEQDHRAGIEKLLDEQKAKLAALETSGILLAQIVRTAEARQSCISTDK